MKNDKSVNICTARTVEVWTLSCPDEQDSNGWTYLEESTLYSFGSKLVSGTYWTEASPWYNVST